MAVVFKNNAKTTLASSLSSSATSVSVADGSVFPSLGSGEIFFCTLDDGTNNEIVKVTAVSSNTLTVVRAQESTTARSFASGDAAELRLTAGILSLFSQTGVAITDEIEAYLDANGLTFPDNVQAQFGTGEDLKIYHDGSNSYISEVGTGHLHIQGRDAIIIEDGTSGENYIYMQRDDKVELYFDGAAKLATTSSGINVTGSTVTDGITTDGSIAVSGDDRNINFDSGTKIIGDHSVDGLQIRTGNTDPIVFKTNGNNTRYRIDGSGNFQVQTTTIIDQSRNLTNIGTISSGAITSTGTSTFGTVTSASYKVGASTVIDNSRNLINIGTISSGGITAPFIDARAASSTSTNTTSYFATSVGGSSSSDDWQNSPISIRERGLVTNTQSANKYSPNINFHWASVVSRSLSMDLNGDFHLGEYNSSGSPIQTTATSMAHLNARGYKVGNTIVINDSRNLTNIGTISSGAITSTGNSVFTGSGSSGNAFQVKRGADGSQAFRVQNAGEVVVANNYLYASHTGTAFYSQGQAVFRNGILNDGGDLAVKDTLNITNSGVLKMASTTVMDASRNLTNIGTISSGGITAPFIDARASGSTSTNTTSYFATSVGASGSGDDWQNSPISIRERGLVGSAQSGGQYSPNINFHWANRVSMSLSMDLNGDFHLGDYNANGVPNQSTASGLAHLNLRGVKIGNVTVINDSRNLTNIGTISSGAISATQVGVTNIVTNKVVKFNGSILDDSSITDTGSAITLGNPTTVTGNFESSSHILAQGYYRIHGSGILLQLEEDAWTNADTHHVLYNGWTSPTGDYVYLAAAGNGTPVGTIVVSDSGGFYYGTKSSTTGAITASATAPLTNTRFRVDTSGNATFAGSIQGTSFSDGTISGITFIDEDSFSTNSATRVPTQQSVKAYVDAQVAGVVDSAPSALNTLNELAAALGDDSNFATTTSTSLGNRLRVDTASQGLNATQQGNAITNLGITATKAELNFVDGVTSNIQTQLNSKLSSFDITTQTDPKYLRSDTSDTFSGSLTIDSGTSMGLRIEHDTFANGLEIHREDNNNAASIKFSNNSGTSGILFSIHSQGDPYWRQGTGTTNYRMWHAGNDGSGSGLDADTLDGIGSGAFLRSDATDTATGTITFSGGINVGDLANGGITGSNYNITGVNTLVMNDPGEGIQFAGTSNVHLAAIDDSTDSVMNFANASELRVNNNKVWTVSNDGSGSGLDADTLDGINSGSFLRSDANDTYTGTLTLGTNTSIKLPNSASYGIRTSTGQRVIDSVDSTLRIGDTAKHNIIRLHGQGSDDFRVYYGATDYQIFHQGNDGSGSGLDADTVDGINSASFLRSDAADTFGSTLSSANNVPIRFVAPNATDTNDGKIGAGVFASGLNIVGAQTSSGTGRQVRIWGSVITDAGAKFWNAGNDGAGSGLDADTLDGIQATGFITNSGTWMGSGFSGSRAFGMSVNGGEIAFLRDHPNTSQMSILVDGGYHAGENNGFYSIYSGNNYSNRVGFNSNSSGHFLINTTNVKANGNTMWHAGNDGSGSGLDADTVDGIQASSFLRSNAADTATGQIFFDAGFDAHPIMLSGTVNMNNVDRSGFYNLYNINSGSTGYAGFPYGTMIAIGNDKGSQGFGLQIAHERTNTQFKVRGMNDTGSTWSSWATIWTSAIDGSGSGLDADLLDGVQGSSYLRSDTADTLTGNITLGSSTKLLFGNSSNYGVGAGGHNYRSVYVDTLESGLSNDPLELVYYQGPKVNIGPGGNKPMNAGSFEIGGTTVINSSRGLTSITSANVAGNITVDYTGNATNDAGIAVFNDNNDWGIKIDKDGTATYGLKIAADGSYPFQITNSSNTEKFRVDSSGNVLAAAGIYPGGSSSTYITHTSPYIQIQTSNGYTRIGSGNSTYSHFYTDRGQFYFNKRIVVDTGNVSSYNEDLNLQNQGSTIAVVKTSGLLLRDENALFFDRASDGGSDLSTKIYADDYPDAGYTAVSQKYWLALESKGGTHVILNSDGATNSGENSYDHFTIFQDLATHAGRQFYVTNVGNVHAKGDITAFQTSNMSDIRLKKNIKPLENCLDKVLSLKGVSFDWKDENKGGSIGFIAQDFEKTVPELVQEKPDISDGTKMHKSIQYANLNAMLVEAIKEQQDQIEYLKSELIKLKENNNGSND